MRRSKRLLAAGLVAALGLTVAACGDDDDGGEGAGTTPEGTTAEGTTAEGTTAEGTTPEGTTAEGTTPEGTTAEGTTAPGSDTTAPAGDCPVPEPAAAVEAPAVGLLFDVTGRGDKSFNDGAAAGLDQAVTDFGVTASESTPSGEGDRAERIGGMVDANNDLVIGVGFLWQSNVQDEAKANPEQLFGIVDAVAVDDSGTPDDFADDCPLTNVASIVFAEEEGSFLTGAAAALKTQTDTVGFIGGVEIALIQKFEAGFKAGVAAVNPDIEVLTQYITQPPDFTGFNDPAKGKEIAASMYEAGADVIYSAAGGSGTGAFEAAAEAGEAGEVWGIGVDSDQYELVSPALQPYILTSMLKKVDVAVYDTIERLTAGEFVGGPQEFDLSTGGIDYSTSGGFVDDIAADLDAFKEQIIAGDIEVPTTP